MAALRVIFWPNAPGLSPSKRSLPVGLLQAGLRLLQRGLGLRQRVLGGEHRPFSPPRYCSNRSVERVVIRLGFIELALAWVMAA